MVGASLSMLYISENASTDKSDVKQVMNIVRKSIFSIPLFVVTTNASFSSIHSAPIIYEA